MRRGTRNAWASGSVVAEFGERYGIPTVLRDQLNRCGLGRFDRTTRERVLHAAAYACFWAYALLLPLAHWLAPSGWLPIPNVALLVAGILLFCLPSNGIRVCWRDRLVVALMLLAAVATIANLGIASEKSLNHLLALLFVSLLNYFLGGRYIFGVIGSQWRTPVLVGYVFSCLLCLFEWVLVNVYHHPLPGFRPSVVEYGSTYILGVRPRSTFSESGHFAFYLACLTPILVAAYREQRQSLVVWCVVLLFAACAILLFSTSLFIVIFLWAMIYCVVNRVYLSVRGLLLMVLLCATGIVFASAVTSLADALVLAKFGSYSFDDRQEKFAAVVDLVHRANLPRILFGHGMGSFEGLGLMDSISSYANFARDTGLVGVLLFLAIIVPVEAFSRRIRLSWRHAFLYSGSAMLLYFSAVPNYYFPHVTFVLGLMSSQRRALGADPRVEPGERSSV